MVWKSGSCDWLAELANNLTSEPQPRIPSLSLLQPALPLSPLLSPSLLYYFNPIHCHNGLSPFGFQPQPGSSDPSGLEGRSAGEARLCFARYPAVYHPVHHPLQWVHGMRL